MYKDTIELHLPNAQNSILSALYQMSNAKFDMALKFLESASNSLGKSPYQPAQGTKCKVNEAKEKVRNKRIHEAKNILEGLLTDINRMRGELLEQTQLALISIS